MFEKSKINKSSKLTSAIVTLSMFQIASFLAKISIEYSSSRYDYGGQSIMGSLFFEFTYFALGAINVALIIFYIFKLLNNKSKPSTTITVVLFCLLITAVFYVQITDWAIQATS